MFDSLLKDQANVTLAGVPDGAESYALARLLAETGAQGLALVFVARDATKAGQPPFAAEPHPC